MVHLITYTNNEILNKNIFFITHLAKTKLLSVCGILCGPCRGGVILINGGLPVEVNSAGDNSSKGDFSGEYFLRKGEIPPEGIIHISHFSVHQHPEFF